MSAARNWTDEETERFTALCRAGTPRDLIAAQMGRTIGGVANFFYWLRDQGRIHCRLAKRSTAPAPCPLNGRDAEVRQLSIDGKSAREIGKQLGVTRQTAAKFMHHHGLYAPDRKPGFAPHKEQRYQLRVNLARVALPDVCEADVKLARQAWREFERAQ
jgi:hypothetical protein